MINKERANIADKLTQSKKASVRSQMVALFSSQLSSLGSLNYSGLIEYFMNENSTPLANALCKIENTKAQQDIKKQFPKSSINDIALALDSNSLAVTRIAMEESHRQLRDQKAVKDNLEAGFVNINLGRQAEPVDIKDKCFWVPASVRHDVKKDDTTGLTRYSFFVYGGVRIQPRINVVKGRNGPLAGNRVGVAQIVQNKINGDLFRDQLAQQLRASGRDVHIEVLKKTPFGRRFMDIEIRQNGVPIGEIETKTGYSLSACKR